MEHKKGFHIGRLKAGLTGGIAARQVRLTLLVALLTGLLLASVQVVLDYFNTQDSIKRQLSQVLESTSPAAEESIWMLNTELAEGVSLGLLRHPAIVEARIETVTGTVLGHKTRNLIDDQDKGVAAFLGSASSLTVELFQPREHNNHIGYLKLKIDPLEINREFLSRVVVIFLSGLIKAFLLAVILLVLFYVSLTKPIQRYARWIADIEPDSPEKWTLSPPLRQRQDELTALGETAAKRFQEARQYFLQLQRTRSELKILNAQLEERVEQRTQELEAALARAEYLASTDELTETLNRRAFMQCAEKRHAEWLRYGRPYALLMLDIDHFKSINDRYGHPAGDQVLRDVSRSLNKQIRLEDSLGRLGGEEFCILLVEATPAHAQQLAERMRQSLADLVVQIDGRAISVTASFGLVCTDGAKMSSFENLLKSADDALYRAKNEGRNRLCIDTH